MSVQSRFVIPAEAGIQAILLDSRQKHAEMTLCGNGHFILWSCTYYSCPEGASSRLVEEKRVL